MNAALLLDHYARIADAPDAIVRLRRFVLDLAVRGKLVEQDASDEPASELLKRIAAERARLVKAGTIRTRTELPAVEPQHLPYRLPCGWLWVRFAEIVEFYAGRTPARNDLSYWNTGDHAWVSIADMEDGGTIEQTKETVSEIARKNIFKSEPEPVGTIVMSFKLTIGKIARLGVPAFHNEAIISIHPHVSALDGYLFMSLPELARAGDTKGAIKGATLNRQSLSNILIPLPPLAEQRRIVAKVDELMALCDQLEAARAEREAARDTFTLSTFSKLNAPDPETFGQDARFALANIAPLTTRTDQIKQLRQTILNLAVRGKLVEQDADEAAASEQLLRIRDERDEMVRLKFIRREKPLEPVRDDETPFEIPGSWVWSRIGDAALFTQYGTSEKSNPSERGVPVLTMGNIQDGLVVWDNPKRIPETSDELPSLFLQKNDLLYNRTNSAELVGKTGIYLGEGNCRTFASYLIRIRCSEKHSLPQYVNLAMNAPIFRETQIVPLIKQQTGQANVNGTALKNMLIPFPSLAEQQCIVAKVDELMTLCDQLEASLTTGEQVRSRLLEAVLHHALEPA
ncbi:MULTISPECIES: restriction endonuclease subunit S [unclassified Novosphingobium]|uniref:restriction endonuclease subunit S n=1 Tax=unclassified Novosphingobium TaxID=2644732 RepID=UPI001494650E|nr:MULTISPECIES: restriction endonuclease subunit S [unclassified Novosphingobium]MBB3358834.1 type I restriction enzyme S subunit [Novosphingobium sp. BK256]MBB3375195.1 type I restriction enzyme S subunit [Novosphingobium sp. BK280]MBB3379117.1 type I restriction enzyme S subunit [Novosphingobium sp. BK258]MBB3420811.1 type I restriction enzyme S subunit [Novosphingobium sp. BK267]MBB3449616.1 type I restriction enzyme S subunit [Novosphingobium sp. BK352]